MDVANAETLPFWSRSNWSALLSGTVTILACGLVITGIGWGITLVAMGPTSFLGAFIACAIVAIAATFISAAVGGFYAGWLIPRSRTIGAVHGFLACALAFLLASLFWMRVTGTTLGAAGRAATATAQTAAQATGAVGTRGTTGITNVLELLGYTPAQARAMVSSAQRETQRLLRGPQAGANVQETATSALSGIERVAGGGMWIYMGVWLISLFLATGFGALGARRAGAPEEERARVPGYAPPLRPQEV